MSRIEAIRTFMAAGADMLARKFREGKLPPGIAWIALRGAGTFARAMLTGDITTDAHAQRRAVACTLCPRRTLRTLDDHPDMQAGYCGPEAEPVEGGTCGCLVTLTVGLVTRPAGKPWVASEYCPYLMWPPG